MPLKEISQNCYIYLTNKYKNDLKVLEITLKRVTLKISKLIRINNLKLNNNSLSTQSLIQSKIFFFKYNLILFKVNFYLILIFFLIKYSILEDILPNLIPMLPSQNTSTSLLYQPQISNSNYFSNITNNVPNDSNSLVRLPLINSTNQLLIHQNLSNNTQVVQNIYSNNNDTFYQQNLHQRQNINDFINYYRNVLNSKYFTM